MAVFDDFAKGRIFSVLCFLQIIQQKIFINRTERYKASVKLIATIGPGDLT